MRHKHGDEKSKPTVHSVPTTTASLYGIPLLPRTCVAGPVPCFAVGKKNCTVRCRRQKNRTVFCRRQHTVRGEQRSAAGARLAVVCPPVPRGSSVSRSLLRCRWQCTYTAQRRGRAVRFLTRGCLQNIPGSSDKPSKEAVICRRCRRARY